MAGPGSDSSDFPRHSEASTINFDLVVLKSNISSPHLAQDFHWRNLLGRDFVVVEGFPVSLRPEFHPGIEISASHLLVYIGTGHISTTMGRTLLEGSRSSLELVKATDNILLWHDLNHSRGTCQCDLNYDSLLSHNITFVPTFDELKYKRHIIGHCGNIPASDMCK